MLVRCSARDTNFYLFCRFREDLIFMSLRTRFRVGVLLLTWAEKRTGTSLYHI